MRRAERRAEIALELVVDEADDGDAVARVGAGKPGAVVVELRLVPAAALINHPTVLPDMAEIRPDQGAVRHVRCEEMDGTAAVAPCPGRGIGDVPGLAAHRGPAVNRLGRARCDYERRLRCDWRRDDRSDKAVKQLDPVSFQTCPDIAA